MMPNHKTQNHFTDACGPNDTVVWTLYSDSSVGMPFDDDFQPIATLEECQQICLYHDGCYVAGKNPITSAQKLTIDLCI